MAWSYQLPSTLNDQQYALWQQLLESRTGIRFLQQKSILQAGLSQRMREIGWDDYDSYYQWVSAEPEGLLEWSWLVDRIAVKETSFFRHQASYDLAREYLLDRLDGLSAGTLDIWSVGSSTGEETYSLAMLAQDLVDYLQADLFVGVTGMDISRSAIASARRGVYSARKLGTVPAAMQNKYFQRLSATEFEVAESLRQRVCFEQGNITRMAQMPAMAMDLIFCQNVLVYFQRQRHAEVLQQMVRRLKPGGLLVMGPGEINGWRHPQMQPFGDGQVQAWIRQTDK